jgi:NAD(P)-dependent dehydrogenase (short-subunit alcohol dehydrogenase family)
MEKLLIHSENYRGDLLKSQIEWKFKGKHVLVTGSSRSIGRAIAKGFATAGARVAVHYQKNRTAAEATLAELPGKGHALFQADLNVLPEVGRLAASVEKTFGHLDILVNNAGIYGYHPLEKVDYPTWEKEWDRFLSINLLAPVHMTYLIARRMISRKQGKIINISSRGAFRGEPRSPAYGASKAALNSFTQSMAVALGPYNIHVYGVAPGFVETDMTVDMLKGEEGAAIRRQSPLNRAARPQEVASVVLFLASGESDYMTGAVLDINGASYLR